MLTRQSARENVAAFGHAIQEGDEDEVEALLDSFDLLEVDIEDDAGVSVSPLMFAAKHESAGCAKVLLRAGAQWNRTFGPSMDTPLLESVSRGDADTVKVLIDAGADLGQADASGRSPLYMSCMMSQPHVTAILVEAGAALEQAMTSVNPGATALYGAALGNRCECCAVRCITLLCEARAVVDARTDQGATPMMVACQHGHQVIAMLLSSYGASRRPEIFEGDYPQTWWARDLADELGHDELVEWLDASGDFTPLHHIEVLLPSRTLKLLRTGSYSPVAGNPSPALRAKNYLRHNPDDRAAQMIIKASEAWSPSTHSLWSVAHRARVLELLEIGYLLRTKLGHGSVLDWWVDYVMPHAVRWEVQPPKQAPRAPAGHKEKEVKEQLKVDKPSPATASTGRQRSGVWAHRLRLRSTRDQDEHQGV